MTFEESNFIDAQGCEWLQAIPLNATRNPAVKDAHKGVGGDVLFGLHIAESAID